MKVFLVWRTYSLSISATSDENFFEASIRNVPRVLSSAEFFDADDILASVRRDVKRVRIKLRLSSNISSSGDGVTTNTVAGVPGSADATVLGSADADRSEGKSN